MSFLKNMLLKINKLFPLPVHPFNLQNEGTLTYGQWQFDKGLETIKFYLDYSSLDEMFVDKNVLDIGCGAGGKTLYYASQGARKVTGIDVVDYYKEEAENLANEKELSDKFEFVIGDASRLPFDNDSFDTIIMNDAMEHVDEPEKVLRDCYRVLKPNGKLFINFPPYHHPFGAHLSDVIGIPWVHLFFSDQTLIEGYKELVKDKQDGNKRIAFRISNDENGKEYFSYINKMTIKRFKRIKKSVDYPIVYYKEIPLRNVFSILAKLPIFKEMFVKMVVCVIEKN